MQDRTVSFVGIGGANSGSDFLYTYLHAHPETCIPKVSTHFFSDAHRYAHGIAWYEERFVQCRAGQMRGECATDYLMTPAAADRIAQSYPHAKLLAVVCHPVNRLYQEYRRAIKTGAVTKKVSLKRYIELHPESLTRGLFADQLEAFFRLYSPLQLYVAVHEDRYADPVAYVQEAYRFLEIDDTFVPKPLRQFVVIDPENPPPKPIWWRLLRIPLAPLRWLRLDRLARYVIRKITPYVRPLLQRYQILTTEKTNRIHAPQPAPIDEELRTVLHEYYAADVQRLSDLLKRNLSREWDIESTDKS